METQCHHQVGSFWHHKSIYHKRLDRIVESEKYVWKKKFLRTMAVTIDEAAAATYTIAIDNARVGTLRDHRRQAIVGKLAVVRERGLLVFALKFCSVHGVNPMGLRRF